MSRRFRASRTQAIRQLNGVTGMSAHAAGTVMFHFRLSSYPGAGVMYVAHSVYSTGSPVLGIVCGVAANASFGGAVRLIVAVMSNTTVTYLIGGSTNLVVNTNYHAAIVQYGGSPNYFQLWLNGAQESVTVVAGSHPSSAWYSGLGSISGASIGAGSTTASALYSAFDGFLTDLCVFDQALSAAEIGMAARGLRGFKLPRMPYQYYPLTGMATPEHDLRMGAAAVSSQASLGFAPLSHIGVAAGTTGPGTLSMNTPSGTVAGDLLLWIMSSTNSTLAFTLPPGFAFLTGYGSFPGAVLYRIATGSEPASYSSAISSPGGIVGAFIRISGVDTSAPFYAAGSAPGLSAGLRTDRPDYLHLTGMVWRATAAATAVLTPPVSYSEHVNASRTFSTMRVRLVFAVTGPGNQTGTPLPADPWVSTDATAAHHTGIYFLLKGLRDTTSRKPQLY